MTSETYQRYMKSVKADLMLVPGYNHGYYLRPKHHQKKWSIEARNSPLISSNAFASLGRLLFVLDRAEM